MWSVKSLEKTHWNNFGLNWFGREKNQTKINLFEPVFGSVRFKNLKKISVWLFILVQNRTESKMLSPKKYNIFYLGVF